MTNHKLKYSFVKRFVAIKELFFKIKETIRKKY